MFFSNLLIKVKYLQINWDLRPGLNVKYWRRHYCAAEVECVWFTTDKTLRLHHWIGLGPSRGLTWFIFHNLLMHFLYWKPTVSILWFIIYLFPFLSFWFDIHDEMRMTDHRLVTSKPKMQTWKQLKYFFGNKEKLRSSHVTKRSIF